MTSGRSSGMKVSQSLMFSISRPEDQIDLNIGGTQTRDHKPTNCQQLLLLDMETTPERSRRMHKKKTGNIADLLGLLKDNDFQNN